MNTIFPVLSMSRADIKWEQHLHDLTPFEEHDGVYFKREDFFAPLGAGGINGSKLRQLIWLMNRGREDASRVISGASVKSPQLSMTTVVAAHYGLPTELVIGATKASCATRHPNVQIAAQFGAKFHIAKVGYNPALQNMVHKLQKPTDMVVEYGITLDHVKCAAHRIAGFHEVGALQTQNIPDVETLIVPAGSCNTLVSIMLGMHKHGTPIKTLRTYGIGPDKMRWVKERLVVLGVDTSTLPYAWEHRNLQTEGFCDYQMEMKESWSDITLHPTYEGKVLRWLNENQPLKQDSSEAFWIVGGKPEPLAMSKFAPLPYQKELTCIA